MLSEADVTQKRNFGAMRSPAPRNRSKSVDSGKPRIPTQCQL